MREACKAAQAGKFPVADVANAFPVVDVEAACAQVVKGAIASSVTPNSISTVDPIYTRQHCIDEEQSAYNRAKRHWPRLTDNERRNCVNTAKSFENHWFYSTLVECTYATVQAADIAGRFPRTFQY